MCFFFHTYNSFTLILRGQISIFIKFSSYYAVWTQAPLLDHLRIVIFLKTLMYVMKTINEHKILQCNISHSTVQKLYISDAWEGGDLFMSSGDIQL